MRQLLESVESRPFGSEVRPPPQSNAPTRDATERRPPAAKIASGADQSSRFQLLLPTDLPLTYRDAAKQLGVPYHVVQRAARKRLVPTYGLGTTRRYVKLRDFFDLMSR